ncbi:MAG: biotin operon repressor [Clostridia bacterium]
MRGALRLIEDRMKSKILRMLKERQTYVSGEELSAQLGVTRAAVWKAIGKLREEGYEIDSATNRGYRLVSRPRDRMTRETLLDAATYDGSMWKEIYYAKQLDSTNLEAKRVRLLEGRGAEPGAVVCEQQFSGRGRRGRGWVSPPGSWFVDDPRSAAQPGTHEGIHADPCGRVGGEPRRGRAV